MKYPCSITWDELMSGGAISSMICGFLYKEFFVFSETDAWGKYAANDYDWPLDVIGFKSGHTDIFKDAFRQPQEEWAEIKHWVPKIYESRVEESWPVQTI